MQAVLANTFLFILQGSALADFRHGGGFYGTLCRCNSESIIKIGQYLQKLCSNEKGSSFLTYSVEWFGYTV